MVNFCVFSVVEVFFCVLLLTVLRIAQCPRFSYTIMKSFGAEVLRQDALPVVHNMRAVQYQIVQNLIF